MRTLLVLSVMIGFLTSLPALGQETPDQQNRRPAGGVREIFSVPGVELSADQSARIAELRKQYAPQLAALQRKHATVLTDEQRRARREAMQVARDAGKNFREAAEAADAAARLTAGQKQQISEAQGELRELVGKVQSEVRALLTDQQRAQLRGQTERRSNANAAGRNVIAPTHRDLKYGQYDRNLMDVWLANSDRPTPVLVSIHGGGFRGGNKSVSGDILSACLEAGISVVAITYRLSHEAIAPAQFLDSARAVQFIRHNAREWNLDPARIAATGGSAGAGISLWLGFHEDLADPQSPDPVLRQSTRLACMAVYNGQTSYDPRFIRDLFPDTTTYKESALAQLFGVDLNRLDELPPEKYKLFEEVSPLTHLTKDDAPAALFYASKLDTPITSQGIGIHHPRFGKALQEKMDDLGIACEVHTGMPRSGDWARLTVGFVKKHLGVE